MAFIYINPFFEELIFNMKGQAFRELYENQQKFRFSEIPVERAEAERWLRARLRELLVQKHPMGREWERTGEIRESDTWSVEDIVGVISILLDED